MPIERTLSIIKPDAVSKNHIGEIIAILEKNFSIKAMKMIRLTKEAAEGFYAVHMEKPFFRPLVSFMTSGPVVVLVLEGNNAVKRYRKIMGATNPAMAEPGTLRKLFAANVQNNAVHGSDSRSNAQKEIAYFFPAYTIS